MVYIEQYWAIPTYLLCYVLSLSLVHQLFYQILQDTYLLDTYILCPWNTKHCCSLMWNAFAQFFQRVLSSWFYIFEWGHEMQALFGTHFGLCYEYYYLTSISHLHLWYFHKLSFMFHHDLSRVFLSFLLHLVLWI